MVTGVLTSSSQILPRQELLQRESAYLDRAIPIREGSSASTAPMPAEFHNDPAGDRSTMAITRSGRECRARMWCMLSGKMRSRCALV